MSCCRNVDMLKVLYALFLIYYVIKTIVMLCHFRIFGIIINYLIIAGINWLISQMMNNPRTFRECLQWFPNLVYYVLN